MSEPILEMTPELQEEEFWKCKASPLYFLKHYVRIKDPEGREIPFELNYFQKVVYATIKKKYFVPYREIDGKVYYRFRKVRIIVVKPRQVGISTFILGLILHDNIFWRGTETAIFLHKEEYSEKMLQRLKDMIELLPAWLRPRTTQKDLDSKSELYFSKTRSRISVGTPGKSMELSGDKGRSETYQNVMISEMPRYTHPADFMQGLSAAVRFGNEYMESTPLKKGDHFHGIFTASRKGENEWTSFFFYWFEDPRNVMKIESAEEAERIRESLKPAKDAEGRDLGNPNERILIQKWGERITLGHIKWRRHTIANMYKGNERRFLQEYTEDPETCFQGEGFNYFEDPEFEIKRQTTTFRPPIKGRFHIITVDCAKGLGSGHDYSVVHVADAETQEQVAEYRSNTLSDRLLPFKIYEMYKRYPGMVTVEGNNIGEGVMAICRNHVKLAGDVIFQWMLWRHSKQQDGYLTTRANKPTNVSNLFTALKTAVKTYLIDEENPLEPQGYRIASEDLVHELGTFLDLGNDCYGAEEGSGNHDDTVVAAMLVVAMLKYWPRYKAKMLELMEDYDITWDTFASYLWPGQEDGRIEPDEEESQAE